MSISSRSFCRSMVTECPSGSIASSLSSMIFVEQIVFDFFSLDELFRELRIAARLFVSQRLEPSPQRVECPSNGLR